MEGKKELRNEGLVTGHDFSRAEEANKLNGALAPVGRKSPKTPQSDENAPQVLEFFFRNFTPQTTPLLLLDYDGTLAPFRKDRFQARPWAGVREILSAIQEQGSTRIAFITGRPGGEIAPLLGIQGIEVWGLHGAEHLFPDGRRELAGLEQRLRHGRLRTGHAEAAAELIERVLPRHLAREFRRRAWEEEPRPQVLSVLGQEDGAGVVGRDQNRRPADPFGQAQQAGSDALGVLDSRLPEVPAMKVTGVRGRRPRSLVHPVDGDAQPAEAADDPETAVVHHVGVELQHHRRRTRVEIDRCHSEPPSVHWTSPLHRVSEPNDKETRGNSRNFRIDQGPVGNPKRKGGGLRTTSPPVCTLSPRRQSD